MGLLDTVALFGTVAFAAPMALVGIDFLWNGRTLAGVAFLAVAAGFVAGQQYGLPAVKRRLANSALDAASDAIGMDDEEPTERDDPATPRE